MSKEHRNFVPDATHAGTVIDYSGSKYDCTIWMTKQGDGFKFLVVPPPLEEICMPVQRTVYLVEEENFWRIGDTSMKFSKLDGEFFCGSEECEFHPAVLFLKTIRKL